MYAKKCDRCGSFYEKSKQSNAVVDTQYSRKEEVAIYSRGRILDLCEGCIKSFSVWFENYKEIV